MGPMTESVGATMVSRSAPAVASLVALALLASDSSGYAQQTTGQLLISSGFNPIAATTPEMVTRLMSFPPNQFVLRKKAADHITFMRTPRDAPAHTSAM
jgi:hypothetical protein